jgi:hypothetical protein
MKSNRLNRIIITALTTLTTFLFCFSAVSVMAQNGGSSEVERQRIKQIMSPNANIEDFRAELKNYMTDLDNALSNFQAIPAVREQFEKTGFNPVDVEQVKASIDQLSVNDLMKMREAYAKFPNWREGARFIYEVSQKASKNGYKQRVSGKKMDDITPNVITPDNCPDISATPSYTDIAITKAFLIAADALMEGFPTDLLSIALRLPAIAAKAGLEGGVLAVETLRGQYEFCISPTTQDVQDIVDAAKQEILDNATANTTTITTRVSTAETNIVNNDNTNKDTIVLNDNNNKNTIVLNDNNNKNTIVNNDNANTLALTNLINATRIELLKTAKDNKEESNNLLLRTQIEADLSSTDGSTFVALYETPSNVCLPSLNNKGLPQIGELSNPIQCGLLDLVRSIVRDTIANVNNSSNAQSFFATGDAQRAAGNYKAAYTWYRRAYKAASN